MKLGIIAYSSDTGLGNQTWEVYKNLNPHKTLIIDLSRFNGMPTNHERYSGNIRITKGLPTREDMDWLSDDVDTVFECETPLNYDLHQFCIDKGVRVVQQFNPEFLDYWEKPILPPPTLFADPSSWLLNETRELNIAPVEILRVPINRELLKFRKITELKTIIHIIGRPTANDRNGTLEFIELSRRLPDYKYIAYLQPPTDARAREYFKIVEEQLSNSKVEVITNVPNYEDLYKDGDLLVLPRKYGGLCLPMQEALSCGLPVIMTDVSPNRDLLPSEWLCEASLQGTFYAHRNIDYYQANVDSLVEIVKDFDIEKGNEKANEIAESLSWENMKDEYNRVLSNNKVK